MESQPQNPEFRNNPENFHPRKSFSLHAEEDMLRALFSELFSCLAAPFVIC